MIGATSYGDLSQFAQRQSRASAFILSIDDEEVLADAEDGGPAIGKLRDFIAEIGPPVNGCPRGPRRA